MTFCKACAGPLELCYQNGGMKLLVCADCGAVASSEPIRRPLDNNEEIEELDYGSFVL